MSLLGKRKNISISSSSNKISKIYYNQYIISHCYSTLICGKSFSFFLNNERNILSCGENYNSILGHKGNYIIQKPLKISLLSNIIMISCGISHVSCLDFDGFIYTFGDNSHGELGNGSSKENILRTYIPQKVLNLPLIDKISCGGLFTICLSYNGDLYSFGYSISGALGLGYICNTTRPKQIENINNIEYIICGYNHVFCKSTSNDYYSWGDNYLGQITHNSLQSIYKPKLCTNIPNNIKSIKCGKYHSLFLTSNGELYSCGSNSYSQLGINNNDILYSYTPILINNISEIKRIECGYKHNLCIDIDNNIWVFGYNIYGQLGLGKHIEMQNKPIKLEVLENIIDISAGGNHSFIKTINNKIYAFGNNSNSQLGIKLKQDKEYIPIQVFKDNEDIWCTNIKKSKQKSARK